MDGQEISSLDDGMQMINTDRAYSGVLEQSAKILVFTFSPGIPFAIVDREGNADPRLSIRNISNFKSEEEMSKVLQSYYESPQEKVLIIEADYHKDKKNINFIKFVVDKVEKESRVPNGVTKSLIVLIHLRRNVNEGHTSTLPMFEEWHSQVYYDINEKPFKLIDNLEIIDTNIKNIIQSEVLFKFDDLLRDLTEKCLLRLNFE